MFDVKKTPRRLKIHKMENSIQRIRSQFEAKPLFHEDALFHELQVYEQRQQSYQHELKNQRRRELIISEARTVGVGSQSRPDPSILAPYRALAISKKSTETREVKLPEPLLRPWSVEKLLKISQIVSTPASKFSPSRKIAPQNDVEVATRNMITLTGTVPTEQYWDKPAQKSNNKNTLRNMRPETDDEHDYVYNQDYFASQGAVLANGSTRQAALTDASSLRAYDRDELLLLNGEDSDRGSSIFDYDSDQHQKEKKKTLKRKEIPETLIEAHIERAAARKVLQEARLQALGIRAPNSHLEIATQADLTGEGSGATDDAAILGQPGASTKYPSRQEEQQKVIDDLSRHVATQGPSSRQPILLEPQVQFTHARSLLHSPPMSSNTDTVWQQVLNEEKRLASDFNDRNEGASNYQLPNVSNTWLNIVQSSSNAEGFLPSSMKSSSAKMSYPEGRAPSKVAQLSLPSREGIFKQIDQLQLAGEEMLIRNKVIDDPLPSSAGGAFSITNGRIQQDIGEHMSRDAIAHVAAAHSDGKAREAALSKYRPIGGYGSTTNPNQLSVEDESRWVSAKIQNEKRRLMTSEAEPLRSWATGLPTNYLGSLGDNGPSVTTHTSQSKRVMGTSQENAARRKWGDVTFSNPNQHSLATGTIENLSAKARSAMFPDAAFN